MSQKDKVIAIACADIHLSLHAPLWRKAEPNWLGAQARVLKQVSSLQLDYECPILCAGDILNIWDSKAELLNWAKERCPELCSIPGQHDLPNHRQEDIGKSGYQTLIDNGTIHSLFENMDEFTNFNIYPFEYGQPITCCNSKTKRLKIAIAHEYVWIDDYNYTTAPKDKILWRYRAKFINKKWNGYDIVIFGDNHKGFITNQKDCKTIFINCGALIRRNSDQIDYKPFVTLIYKSGKVERHFLDISEDKYSSTIKKAKELPKEMVDMKDFFNSLDKLEVDDWNLLTTFKAYSQNRTIPKPVKTLILRMIESAENE